MNYKITTENFEGPIDVLLSLIEKRKMQINDISLAEITDDYLLFIESIDHKSLIDMTHFIYVASVLTLIKSKSLLPNLELSEDENEDIEELKYRINLLNVFIEISKSIKNEFSYKRKRFIPKNRKREVVFSPHENLNHKSIIESLNNVFKEIPKKEDKKKEAHIRIVVSIEDMMKSLKDRIRKASELSFYSFIKTKRNDSHNEGNLNMYNVVGFLAMLELVKGGVIDVLQDKNFDDISIKRLNN